MYFIAAGNSQFTLPASLVVLALTLAVSLAQVFAALTDARKTEGRLDLSR